MIEFVAFGQQRQVSTANFAWVGKDSLEVRRQQHPEATIKAFRPFSGRRASRRIVQDSRIRRTGGHGPWRGGL